MGYGPRMNPLISFLTMMTLLFAGLAQSGTGRQVTRRGHGRDGRCRRGREGVQAEGHRARKQTCGQQSAVPLGGADQVTQPPRDGVALASGEAHGRSKGSFWPSSAWRHEQSASAGGS